MGDLPPEFVAALHQEPAFSRLRASPSPSIMENDRAQTNLSADPESAQADVVATQDGARVPKKRFVGRRAAAEKATKNGAVSIEDSGAVQGTKKSEQDKSMILTHGKLLPGEQVGS